MVEWNDGMEWNGGMTTPTERGFVTTYTLIFFQSWPGKPVAVVKKMSSNMGSKLALKWAIQFPILNVSLVPGRFGVLLMPW